MGNRMHWVDYDYFTVEVCAPGQVHSGPKIDPDYRVNKQHALFLYDDNTDTAFVVEGELQNLKFWLRKALEDIDRLGG